MKALAAYTCLPFCSPKFDTVKKSEYDQEILQLHTAYQPPASWGGAIEH